MDKSHGLNTGAVPYAIYATANYGIWFTDRGTIKAVGYISTSNGSTQEFPTLTAFDQLELASSSLPTGEQWIAYSQSSGNHFGGVQLAPGFMGPRQLPLAFPVTPGLSQNGIAGDNSGNVYVAVGANTFTIDQGIYSYDLASGTVGIIHNLAPDSYDFTSIIVDHLNYLWVTEPHMARVERTDRYGGNRFVDNLAFTYPTSIAEGPDHMIYVVDVSSHSILQLPQSYSTMRPLARFNTPCQAAYVTAGVANDLWFTEPKCNAIARLMLNTHTITEYHNSAYPGGQPDHITVDAEGVVWFTDRALNKIFAFASY